MHRFGLAVLLVLLIFAASARHPGREVIPKSPVEPLELTHRSQAGEPRQKGSFPEAASLGGNATHVAQAERALGATTDENSSLENTLQSIQRHLAPQEALLSFYLGEERCYLSVVTPNSLEFHRLPDPKQFIALAQQWLITSDDALFDLPFAALVVEKREGSSRYPVEEHSTERFYDTADPRWTSVNWSTPDDTGELFQSCDRDLRIRCDRGADGRVGAPLQYAQLEMLRSNTWRSNPSYWSASYAVGKEQ
jgi:hypothetical protein